MNFIESLDDLLRIYHRRQPILTLMPLKTSIGEKCPAERFKRITAVISISVDKVNSVLSRRKCQLVRGKS